MYARTRRAPRTCITYTLCHAQIHNHSWSVTFFENLRFRTYETLCNFWKKNRERLVNPKPRARPSTVSSELYTILCCPLFIFFGTDPSPKREQETRRRWACTVKAALWTMDGAANAEVLRTSVNRACPGTMPHVIPMENVRHPRPRGVSRRLEPAAGRPLATRHGW